MSEADWVGEDGPPGALARPLPHSEEAERAALGSMLLDKDAIGEAFEILERAGGYAAFFHEHHGLLYRVLTRMYFAGQIVDDVVLKDQLVREGLFDKLGGYEFLTRLASSVGSSARVRHYAGIVADHAQRRRLIAGCHRTMEAAFERAEIPALLELSEREIGSVSEVASVSRASIIGDIGERRLREYEAFQPGELNGIPTGFHLLDEMCCGLQDRELTIIAASASVGKTAFALSIAANMAAAGVPAIFFSLEMSEEAIYERLLCMQAGVNLLAWRQHRVGSDAMTNVGIVARRMAAWKLYIDDHGEHTLNSIRAAARMAKRKLGVRAVFVDYLQLMTAPSGGRDDGRTAEVGRITRGLKSLAKDLGLPVVAMAQLNRQIDQRAGRARRPRMSDLRESGTGEQDADGVILIHRESYYVVREEEGGVDDGTADVIVAKQRNGPVGTIRVGFDAYCARFTNAINAPPEAPLEMPTHEPQESMPWA